MIQKEPIFSKEEQEFMANVLKLDLNFNRMTGDDWILLEDTVGDRLTLHCLDKDYNPSAEGVMCEHILDKLP